MDYRCPLCKADLGHRKLSQAIVARMEMDCTHCKGRIHLNIHRVEMVIVMFNFAAIVVMGGLAYWFQSQGLMLAALGAAMAGVLALPLLERTYLRAWPRYTSTVKNPGP
jgi:DNA-directed RNA polymerase subunit RPC12/RpoP